MLVDEINATIAELKKYNLAIGWLNLNNQIQHIQALQVARNLTDFWSFELNYLYDIPILYDTDIDNLLANSASKNYDYLLILSLGIDFKDEITFFKKILDYIKNYKFSFVGHVLDRKDLFYKVHPQTILININWYKENQTPTFGKELNELWETEEPQRSVENYHDDYTPYYVSRGNKKKLYKGKLLGWNFIITALKSSYPILIFDNCVRKSKIYFYPEDSTNWVRTFTRMISNIISSNVFVFNTEKINQEITLKNYNLDYCFVSAAGFNSIIIPFLLKMKKNSTVVVFDLNTESISLSKHLVQNYKGQDLEDFFKSALKSNDVNDIDENQIYIKNLLQNGLFEFINDIVPSLNYEYIQLNLFNEESWEYFSINDKNVYINLSNIFTFLPTAKIFSLKDRIETHNLFFSKILNSSSNYIIDYRGFYFGNKKLLTPAEITNTTMPDVLKIFPWNVEN